MTGRGGTLDRNKWQSCVGICRIALLEGIASGLFGMGALLWAAVRSGPGKTFNQLAGWLDVMIVAGGGRGNLLFGMAVSHRGFSGPRPGPTRLSSSR